ncbi:hypothetical protein RRG08_052435 [Elysia crispata]|uniref:Uncharacterized protein n=1 Tax=Elysia crispata TaxID=231223 RepID=A0AAE1E876_9GAST|nr:hypothetical protein RRG08_052435 [Elysia crispata]
MSWQMPIPYVRKNRRKTVEIKSRDEVCSRMRLYTLCWIADIFNVYRTRQAKSSVQERRDQTVIEPAFGRLDTPHDRMAFDLDRHRKKGDTPSLASVVSPRPPQAHGTHHPRQSSARNGFSLKTQHFIRRSTGSRAAQLPSKARPRADNLEDLTMALGPPILTAEIAYLLNTEQWDLRGVQVRGSTGLALAGTGRRAMCSSTHLVEGEHRLPGNNASPHGTGAIIGLRNINRRTICRQQASATATAAVLAAAAAVTVISVELTSPNHWRIQPPGAAVLAAAAVTFISVELTSTNHWRIQPPGAAVLAAAAAAVTFISVEVTSTNHWRIQPPGAAVLAAAAAAAAVTFISVELTSTNHWRIQPPGAAVLAAAAAVTFISVELTSTNHWRIQPPGAGVLAAAAVTVISVEVTSTNHWRIQPPGAGVLAAAVTVISVEVTSTNHWRIQPPGAAVLAAAAVTFISVERRKFRVAKEASYTILDKRADQKTSVGNTSSQVTHRGITGPDAEMCDMCRWT